MMQVQTCNRNTLRSIYPVWTRDAFITIGNAIFSLLLNKARFLLIPDKITDFCQTEKSGSSPMVIWYLSGWCVSALCVLFKLSLVKIDDALHTKKVLLHYMIWDWMDINVEIKDSPGCAEVRGHLKPYGGERNWKTPPRGPQNHLASFPVALWKISFHKIEMCPFWDRLPNLKIGLLSLAAFLLL